MEAFYVYQNAPYIFRLHLDQIPKTESSCTKGPIKQPNKSVQMKVILLYFCSQTQ